MISTKKRIQCFIFALVFALAFSYNCYMDSRNNKVYATSEAIAYSSWELFQALMITLGFSVSSTTSAAPTVDQILDEFLGDTYDMWARENLSDEAMESNKQFLRDFLETEYEASAYATNEILSWLPSYVNSDEFARVIECQNNREVVYDSPNTLSIVSKMYNDKTGQITDYTNSIDVTIVNHNAEIKKVLRQSITNDDRLYGCGSYLVSLEPFSYLYNGTFINAKQYSCIYGSVYVCENCCWWHSPALFRK